MGKVTDLVGQRFGRLLVIERYGYTDAKRRLPTWLCQCDCGNIIQLSTGRINFEDTKSCGCLRRKTTIDRNKTHGFSKTRLYKIWVGMKKRCYNEKSENYRNYGGRGIAICNEWLDDFMAFRKWALESGYAKNLSIDRIDTNGNYEPSNCRWATNTEQARNQRKTIHFELFGERKTLSEWCEYAEIKYMRAYQRYKNGNFPFDEIELEKIRTKISRKEQKI